jgi:hypothetical protein
MKLINVKGWKTMKRQAEFILGLVGGIIFSIVAVVYFLLSMASGRSVVELLPSAEASGSATVISYCIIILLLALLGLFGAIMVNKKDVTAGILMMVSGILGFASSGFPWSFLWSVPQIVAGIMACVPKKMAPSARESAPADKT